VLCGREETPHTPNRPCLRQIFAAWTAEQMGRMNLAARHRLCDSRLEACRFYEAFLHPGSHAAAGNFMLHLRKNPTPGAPMPSHPPIKIDA
jgi:hypothetical protein